MLFHITHHHDEHTCPIHDADVSHSYGKLLDSLNEHVTKVIGVWVDPGGHDFFIVVDAEEVPHISAGLFPIIPKGTARIQPVGDYAAMLAMRDQLAQNS